MPSLKHAFVSAADQSSDPSAVSKNEWNAEHVGSTEWDTVIVKSSPQSVTNSTTMADDENLQWSAASGELWKFEVILVYEATTACDYKCDLAISTGTMTGWWRYVGSDTTANAILVSTGVRYAAVANTTAVAAGGQGEGIKSSLLIEGIVRADATATLKMRFAQNTLTAGVSAINWAGCILRLRKLAA